MLMRKGRSKVEKVQYTVTTSTIPMAVNFGLVRVLRLLLVHVSRSRQTFLPIFFVIFSASRRTGRDMQCHLNVTICGCKQMMTDLVISM